MAVVKFIHVYAQFVSVSLYQIFEAFVFLFSIIMAIDLRLKMGKLWLKIMGRLRWVP